MGCCCSRRNHQVEEKYGCVPISDNHQIVSDKDRFIMVLIDNIKCDQCRHGNQQKNSADVDENTIIAIYNRVALNRIQNHHHNKYLQYSFVPDMPRSCDDIIKWLHATTSNITDIDAIVKHILSRLRTPPTSHDERYFCYLSGEQRWRIEEAVLKTHAEFTYART